MCGMNEVVVVVVMQRSIPQHHSPQMTKTGSDIQEFVQAGIPVRHDRAVSHMHHKYCIIDARVLMNGSFNWTRQAVLQNNENVVITHNMAVVAKFGEQFEKLWQQFSGNRA